MAKKEEIETVAPAAVDLDVVAGGGDTLIRQDGSDLADWTRTVRQRACQGGFIVQFETIIRNPDGSYALSQSSVFVPN